MQNWGVGGWGLTQEIRRFYDVAANERIAIVVLQFSGNDPADALACAVTSLNDGGFEFRDVPGRLFWLKRSLSRSFVQRSQVYSLVRDSAYRFLAARRMEQTRTVPGAVSDDVPAGEKLHADLLTHFAAELNRRDVKLVLVTVNRQLAAFQHLNATVKALSAAGQLTFFDPDGWVPGHDAPPSVEGHLWGAAAHRIIGDRLADWVLSSHTIEARRRD